MNSIKIFKGVMVALMVGNVAFSAYNFYHNQSLVQLLVTWIATGPVVSILGFIDGSLLLIKVRGSKLAHFRDSCLFWPITVYEQRAFNKEVNELVGIAKLIEAHKDQITTDKRLMLIVDDYQTRVKKIAWYNENAKYLAEKRNHQQ